MNKLVVSNLIHRPIRTLISVTAVAVEVTLILVIVGLSLGILNDAKQRQLGIGADVMVQPPGSSFLSGVSGAPVSIKVADRLRELEHVAAVAPVVTQVTTTGNVEVIYGIDLESFEKLGRPFNYLSGGPFQSPNEMLVDDVFANANKVRVGDTLTVLNHEFKVAGIVEHGKGARKFLPIERLQELVGAEGRASIFYVRLDNPGNVERVREQIRAVPGMESYVVRSLQEYASLMTPANLPGFSTFISVVIAVAVAIGFIVIFQSMYTAVMERTREIGILKSLGASKLYVVNVILRETMLLAAVGIVLGIVISYLTQFGLTARFPTLTVVIQSEWVLYAALIALGGAALGAIYPAWKAAQKDPIDALAYE